MTHEHKCPKLFSVLTWRTHKWKIFSILYQNLKFLTPILTRACYIKVPCFQITIKNFQIFCPYVTGKAHIIQLMSHYVDRTEFLQWFRHRKAGSHFFDCWFDRWSHRRLAFRRTALGKKKTFVSYNVSGRILIFFVDIF